MPVTKYLSGFSLCVGFPGLWPAIVVGVAAVGFVPKKAIGAADGIKAPLLT